MPPISTWCEQQAWPQQVHKQDKAPCCPVFASCCCQALAQAITGAQKTRLPAAQCVQAAAVKLLLKPSLDQGWRKARKWPWHNHKARLTWPAAVFLLPLQWSPRGNGLTMQVASSFSTSALVVWIELDSSLKPQVVLLYEAANWALKQQQVLRSWGGVAADARCTFERMFLKQAC